MKKKKWVVASTLAITTVAIISCETPNKISKDLNPQLPPSSQPVLRPREPEGPKPTTPKESSPVTPSTTPKTEEPKKVGSIKTQPSNEGSSLDKSKTKETNNSSNKPNTNLKPTTPSDKNEEPKIEGTFPNPIEDKVDSEKTLPQVLAPKQVNKEFDEKLKEAINSIPNTLTIAQDKVKQFQNTKTILHKFKYDYPSSYSYETFVEPLFNVLDKDYKISFDFSQATSDNSEIQNVGLKLSDSKSGNSQSKIVSLSMPREDVSTSSFYIEQKELPPVFKQIFPSFLAFALVNSNTTVEDSFFSTPEKVIDNLGFGVGLINSFLEIKSKNNQYYKIKTIKATPNDDEGSLSITVKAENQDDNYQETIKDSKEYTFVFNNLAKNSDELVKLQVDNIQLRSDIINDSKLKTKIETNLQSVLTKHKLIQLIKKHLQIFINPKQQITNYKEVLLNVQKILKQKNHILFPQIIFFNSLVENNADNNIQFSLTNKTLSYTWNLTYSYLDFHQYISDNDSLFSGESKTTTLTGAIELN